MDCDQYQEGFSARLDGEDMGMPAEVLDQHLAGCERCRSWADRSLRVSRATRLYPAEPVPDLTTAILAAIAADRRAGPVAPAGPDPGPAKAVGASRRRRLAARLGGDGGGAPGVIRLALALVAAAQVLAALPALFGNDLGATVHVAHEQGAWGLAIAAGLALGAWRPARASALLPLLGVFVACLGLMTALDMQARRVAPSAEVPHVMTAVGVVLLWLEIHSSPVARHWPRPTPRPGAGPGMAA